MKKALTIVGVVAALAGTLTFVAAGSFKRGEQVTEADALPSDAVLTTVRAMGLNPISEPVRRGPYYVLQAYDARGIQVRVFADAQFGDILSIAPANRPNTAYEPRYERGPRIIHVPQPDDVRASVNRRDEPAASNDDDVEEVAPPPRRRVTPPPQRRSDAPPPPPPSPRRTVLSAPPPPAEGPTPVHPTPRFNSKAEQADKFGSPRDLTVGPDAPPPGYTPPAAVPQDE